MFEPERRVDGRRMESAAPVEIVDLGLGSARAGTARNLSDWGIGARCEKPLAVDTEVLVRLSLGEQKEPIEQRGTVVWCAPDIYDAGAEIGLKLFDGAAPPERDEPDAAAPEDRSPPKLSPGQIVRVVSGGIELEAVIARVGDIADDGSIGVLLLPGDESSCAPPPAALDLAAAEEVEIDADEWTPHPFRDAWNAARSHLVPAIALAARATLVASRFAARACARIWRRIPEPRRRPVEGALRRAASGLARWRRRLPAARSSGGAE